MMLSKTLLSLSLIIIFSCRNREAPPTEKVVPDQAGIYYSSAQLPIEESYVKFKRVLEKNDNISIIAELDHSQNAAKAGKDLSPSKIIFFGNPELGTALMQKNQLAGLDLPQRVLFFEWNNRSIAAYNSTSFLKERYGLQQEGALEKIAAAMDNLVSSAMENKVIKEDSLNKDYLQRIKTINSTQSFDDTYSALRETLESNEAIRIVAEVDHGANAAVAGMELRPTRLVIFGNPQLGTPLMQASNSVGLDLPQKILVWQDGDGAVKISYNTVEFLQSRHKIPNLKDQLDKMATALENLAAKAAGF